MNTQTNTKDFPEGNEVISIEHEGVKLIAKFIVRTKRDFVIEIISPYTGFTTGLHKPYFGSAYSSFLDEEGLQKAEGRLINLYLDLTLFFDNIESIKEDFREFKLEHYNRDIIIQNHTNEIKELKKSMKLKNISPNQYQKSIRPLKKEIETIRWQKSDFFENFLKKHLKINVNYTLKNEIYTYLYNSKL